MMRTADDESLACCSDRLSVGAMLRYICAYPLSVSVSLRRIYQPSHTRRSRVVLVTVDISTSTFNTISTPFFPDPVSCRANPIRTTPGPWPLASQCVLLHFPFSPPTNLWLFLLCQGHRVLRVRVFARLRV